METEPDSQKDENAPTFGEMLSRVVVGTAQGFTVFDKEGEISYTFMDSAEPSSTNPADGETWFPITPEGAQDMLADLTIEAPEELEERGAFGGDARPLN